MCEPNHSIIQFPPRDDDDPYSSLPGGRLGMVLGKVAKLGSKIRGFFHISRMGAGHSEATQQVFGRVDLPEHNSLEVAWWERRVKFDFPTCIHADHPLRATALETATEYANRTSIGNLQTLRRFLEESITQSSRGGEYLWAFRQMLTPAGIVLLDQKTRQVFGKGRRIALFWTPEEQARIAKVIVGMTRKRNLLSPVWADDGSLWKGGVT